MVSWKMVIKQEFRGAELWPNAPKLDQKYFTGVIDSLINYTEQTWAT